jgi:hypothetical protein
MGGETTKIGVGPSGAIAALIQLIAIAVGGGSSSSSCLQLRF